MTATLTPDQKKEYTFRKEYINKEFSELVGKTIVQIRPLTPKEHTTLGWEWDFHTDAMIVIFNDDTCFIPMADPEGNGAGFLLLADLGAE